MVTAKLKTLLIATGALTLVLTGCTATQSDPPTSATQQAPATTAPVVPSDSPFAPGTIPPDADLAATPLPIALDGALAAIASVSPGLTVTALGVEYDRFFGKWVWDATAQNGTQKYDITINAETGAVLESKFEKTDGSPRAVDATMPMTPETAMATAQSVLPGTVSGWSLEWEDDVLTYDIDIRTDAGDGSVTVDAQTGNASIDD